MARIELILRKSVDSDSYEVNLLSFDEFGNPSQSADAISSLPPALSHSIDQWQGSFSQLVGTRRGTIKAKKVVHGNCSNCAEDVREQFMSWLSSQESWQRLQQYTRQSIASNEEVQVNIQTLDSRLRLLPWHEAFEENYRQVETSITLTREFRKQGCLQVKPQVRILAVLGNPVESLLEANNGPSDHLMEPRPEGRPEGQPEAIDVSFDQKQLELTRARGAYIETLNQPSTQELKAALRDIEGWHIFFFAGHSRSQQDNSIGSIVLNGEEDPLSIHELKHEMDVAINRGLQLAIFNSCDGLGLASQLAELNLPQSIVMREPVPDEVAKDFLQQFLSAFSNNRSLFESVRTARKYLKEHWDTQDKYPGSSWLPTIVRNPAVSLPLWSDFVAESPLSRRHLYPLVAATFVLVTSLYVCLLFEFNHTASFSRVTGVYYAQLYPHLILYPWLFLWVAYYMLYKAWCQIRNRPKLWRHMFVCLAFALCVLRVELTSPYMMLFELKDSAMTTVAVEQAVMEEIASTPDSILDIAPLLDRENSTVTIRKRDLETAFSNFLRVQQSGEPISEDAAEGYHKFMYVGLDFATWRGSSAFSISRKFYGLTFVLIVAAVLISGLFWREIRTKYVFNKAIFVRYIIATQLVLLSWFPLRTYHNLVTKSAVFGSVSPISGLDLIAYVAVLVLLTTSIYKSWKFEASFVAGTLSTFVVAAFVSVGMVRPQLIGMAFGTQSNPDTWFLWPMAALISIYMIYSDAFAARPHS